jgi:hypothetical protein
MKTRLALVAVTTNHTGPWQRVKGHEQGVLIEGLGSGELITMHCEFKELEPAFLVFNANGQFPFPNSLVRFRFQKSNTSGSSTFVKVVISNADVHVQH